MRELRVYCLEIPPCLTTRPLQHFQIFDKHENFLWAEPQLSASFLFCAISDIFYEISPLIIICQIPFYFHVIHGIHSRLFLVGPQLDLGEFSRDPSAPIVFNLETLSYGLDFWVDRVMVRTFLGQC